MNEVGQLLDRLAADGPTRGASDVFDGARRRSGPIRRHRRRVVAGAVALTVALVAGAVTAVVATTGEGSRTKVSSTPPASTPTSTPVSGPTTIDVGPAIVQPTAVAVGNGRIWVTGYTAGNGPAPLEEFDAATGNLVGRLTLPDNSPFALAIGDHAVWVRAQQGEDSTHLYKVDSYRHVIVATISFHVDGGLAVTADDVWAIDGIGHLLRIDPQTARVVSTINLPGGLYPPLSVSAGPIGVFVSSPYDGSVSHIDTRNERVLGGGSSGSFAGAMAQVNTSVWVATKSLTGVASNLTELNNVGFPTGRTVELGSRILGFASDGHSLWAATDGGVARVDPVSGAVTPVTPPASTTTVTDLAADPATGAVWGITLQPVPRLVRLSP